MGYQPQQTDASWLSQAESGLAMVHQKASSKHSKRRSNCYNTFKRNNLEKNVTTDNMDSPPFLVVLAEAFLANVVFRVNLYMALTAIFTLLTTYITPYAQIFFTATPDNILELYFMQYIHVWAIVAASPLAFITGFVFNRFEGILYALTRVATALGVWFAFTNFFHLIHFDVAPDVSVSISGHSFVLCWFALFVVEESRAMATWSSLTTLVTSSSEPNFIFDSYVHHIRQCINHLTLLLRLSLVMMALFVIICDLMLITSLAFFHTWMDKLVSLALAVLLWLLLYRGVYELPLRKGGTPYHMALVALAKVELIKEESEREKK